MYLGRKESQMGHMGVEMNKMEFNECEDAWKAMCAVTYLEEHKDGVENKREVLLSSFGI